MRVYIQSRQVSGVAVVERKVAVTTQNHGAQADHFDDILQRLHRTGPEFRGWLSNHGPMACDALIRISAADGLDDWLSRYSRRLEERPPQRWAIGEDEWREYLGDPSRLGDWLFFFARALAERPWQDVLSVWLPRLLPGSAASAAHPLIRSGHATRALRENETPARVSELADALGYWAARWEPLEASATPRGEQLVRHALAEVPPAGAGGGYRTRLAAVREVPAWSARLRAVRPPARPQDVPAALTELTDSAVSIYRRWGHANAVMLVHMATAPRAAGLMLPSLQPQTWRSVYDAACAVSFAIASMYRPAPGEEAEATPGPGDGDHDAESIAHNAAVNGDEHVIKFTEVALESATRGNEDALAAAAYCARLVTS